jgi:hypothetical protein
MLAQLMRMVHYLRALLVSMAMQGTAAGAAMFVAALALSVVLVPTEGIPALAAYITLRLYPDGA